MVIWSRAEERDVGEREARISRAGEWGASASAVWSPRPPGEMPVMRMVLLVIWEEWWEVISSEVVEKSKFGLAILGMGG